MTFARLFTVPLFMSALLVAAVPASAERSHQRAGESAVPAINTFANQATGRCLDDSFAYNTRPHPCNGLDFQKWSVGYPGGDYRDFKNVNTGRCIGADNTSVSGGECRTSSQAMWILRRWNDGTFELRNVWSGLCLADVGRLAVETCNASTRQSWY
jgi:hypothetical protein